jgi:hypothetical protein
MVNVAGDPDSDRMVAGGQRSLGQLFGEVSRELGALVEQEVELAKAQLREESGATTRVNPRLSLMIVTGGLCLLFLSFALAWGLAEIIPPGFAFLVVAVLYGVATAVLVAQYRRATAEEQDGAEVAVLADAGYDGVDGSDGSSTRRIEIAQGRVELG